MREEHRSSIRHISFHAAWVDDGSGSPRKCTIWDISEGGAKVHMATPDRIGDKFVLWFEANGVMRRKCKVVWRDGDDLGVAFEISLDERQVEIAAQEKFRTA